MDHTWNTLNAKAIGRNALYSALGSATASSLVWRFGEPLLIEHWGVGAPWWAYLLLFIKLLLGIFHMLGNDTALQSAAPILSGDLSGDLPETLTAQGMPLDASGDPEDEKLAAC